MNIAKHHINTILICAATDGFRMRPVTQYLPKVLLPIKNIPIIIYHLERAEKAGIKKAIITIEKRLGKMIEISIKNGYNGKLKIYFVYQNKRNGLGHAILKCKKYLKNNFFVFCLADEYNHSENIFKLSKKGIPKNFQSILAIRKCNDIKKIQSTASIGINRKGKVLNYMEKPAIKKIRSSYIFSGLAIFGTDFIKILEKVKNNSNKYVNGEFSIGYAIQTMIESGGKVGFIKENGYYINLSTTKDLLYSYEIFNKLKKL